MHKAVKTRRLDLLTNVFYVFKWLQTNHLDGSSVCDLIACTNMLNGALCREKDALWQKTDALEFEQKLRDEETERDVNYCLGCRSQFSWWLRKYNCRSDGSLYNKQVYTSQ